MKFNKWTVALAAIGVVSLASAARADEAAAPKMNAVQTALSSTTLSGYVDTAATWRPGTDSTTPLSSSFIGNAAIPAYSYAKNDGFSLNAVDIALDHPEDESPWAAGYHVELMLGPDSPVASVGSVLPGGFGLTGVRQAYLTLRLPVGNGIDVKVGTFDTIIGYESSSDPLDPNYTRSYGYSIEPTTHTGVLATYKVNDMVSVSAGIANTFTEGPILINATPTYESQKTYMGTIAFTAPDSAGFMQGATVNFGVIHAVDSQLNGAGSPLILGFAGTQTSWYAGMTLPTPVKALKVGATFDYHEIDDSGPGNSSDDSTWVLGLYGSFQATDKLSLNLRGEYVANDGAGLYFDNNGNSANAEEFTATVQYNLWANVISRAEFRWDHAEHGTPFGVSSATGAPFRANDFMLALNLIYQF